MVFFWRNDPFIIMRGSSKRIVTWEEHARWFKATLMGGEQKMLIVLVNGEPAGQGRFKRVDQNTCVISAYLLEESTGRGCGVEAIRKGCDVVFSEWPVAKIVACVREDNQAARSGFRKAGFMESGQAGECPTDHSKLVLTPGLHDDPEAPHPSMPTPRLGVINPISPL